MKTLTAIIFVVSIGVILIGDYIYQAKLSEIASTAMDEHQLSDEKGLLNEEETEEKIKEAEEKKTESEISDITANLPEELSSLIQTTYENAGEIEVIAFGSKSLVDSQNEGLTPWPLLLEQELNERYGMELFSVETYSFGDETSLQVIENGTHIEVAERQADIVIVEPFIWNNNGEVDIIHSFQSLTIFSEAFRDAKEDVMLFVQPPQPIFGTYYYGLQVEELKEFSSNEGFYYVDHWVDWPSAEDEELLMYTNNDHHMPTQEGHQLWAESISKFFMTLD